MFSIEKGKKEYGPFALPSEDCKINGVVYQAILSKTGVSADILYNDDWGIWAGSTCRRQCRHALAVGYHVCSARYVPSDDVCNSSDRRVCVQGG